MCGSLQHLQAVRTALSGHPLRMLSMHSAEPPAPPPSTTTPALPTTPSHSPLSSPAKPSHSPPQAHTSSPCSSPFQNTNHAGHGCSHPLTQLPNPDNMALPLPTTPSTVMRRDCPLMLTVMQQDCHPNATSTPNCLTPRPTLTLQLPSTLPTPLLPLFHSLVTCFMCQRVVTQHQHCPLPHPSNRPPPFLFFFSITVFFQSHHIHKRFTLSVTGCWALQCIAGRIE